MIDLLDTVFAAINPSRCFCPRNFFSKNGLEIYHATISDLYINGKSVGVFQGIQLILLAVFGALDE